VVPRTRISRLSDLPDNRILECAVAAKADAIVTGDRAMLALEEFQDIPILTLAQYMTASGRR
jgi:predicted nucleic acid-binding protein